MAKNNSKTTSTKTARKSKKAEIVKIKNISRLTDAEIGHALSASGVEVPQDANRATLIGLAASARLWDYNGNVVPQKYKDTYGVTQRCGDELSEVLNGHTRDGKGNLDLAILAQVQQANGLDGNRWSHLNNGQQLMNTSNVLRGRVRRGETVTIGGHRWN